METVAYNYNPSAFLDISGTLDTPNTLYVTMNLKYQNTRTGLIKKLELSKIST